MMRWPVRIFILFAAVVLLAGPVCAQEFSDISKMAGVADDGLGKGVAFADIDNDGYIDIYVSNKGGANKLYRNLGNGTFEDITATAGAGIDDPGFTMRKFLFIFVCLLFLPSVLLAASGVKGRVAWRGELIPGVTIKAYHSIDAIALKKVFAVSGPTGQDGTYQLELPPGRYYLTAGNGSQPGDYFCYYSGAPIVVPATGFRQVGFNLIRIPQPIESRTGKRSGLWGEISFQGQPLERTYLYVYKSTETDFKGPA